VDDDNLDPCMTESCKKKNIAVPLVASFSALVLILLISLGFWLFRRQKRQKGTSQRSSVLIHWFELMHTL